MNQAVLFNFAIVKNERIYQINIQPGSPWEDIQAVLDEYKIEFEKLHIEAKEQEAQQISQSQQTVEPEIVGESDAK